MHQPSAYLLLSLLSLLVTDIRADDTSELEVLSKIPEKVAAPGKQLELLLKQQANTLLDKRREKFEELDGPAACQQWQQERRQFFFEQLGGFPERTPLNHTVVKTFEGKGYRVETVMLESRPNFHVTANLYLPNTQGPYPAVLIPCGHSHNGKAAGGYQRMCILLARHGIAALIYDPIGQGERYQIIDYENDHEYFTTVSYKLAVPHPRVQYVCTIEHTTMGLGCVLLGTNMAQYRIWDGMRCIDYLQSRKDIITDRIGCAGNSGGGTLTAYLMALDDRIYAAAPSCYLTTFQKLIETKGAQDAEQNIHKQIAFGMDEADYVMMRAPRPTLICAGTRDVTFDIEGTWELYRQAKRFYSRLGYPLRVEINEADAPHGMYLQQREAIARFMHRWLLGEDRVINEVDPATLPDPIDDASLRALSEGDWPQEQLYATPEGQVLLMEGEKSVFQINAEHELALREERTSRWKSMSVDDRQSLIRKTIGVPETQTTKKSKKIGTVQRDGYHIEKWTLEVEEGLLLPALCFIPEDATGKVHLYLHGTSMTADVDGPIMDKVKQGEVVFAAELSGIGETETGHDKRDYGRGRFGRDVQEIFLAYLIGKSYVGMRTADVLSWNTFLQDLCEQRGWKSEIEMTAEGEAAIPTLHAAALSPGSFAKVTLKHMIPSWAEVVKSPETLNQASSMVHGALKQYDLPDLISLAGPERIHVVDPVNALGKPFKREKN